MHAIAILLRGLPPDAVGGMETQTDQMATHLRDRGHEVCVITKAGSGDAPDRPYDVLRLPHLRWHPMLSDLTFLIAALVVLVRHHARFDVLQCMMLYPMGAVGTVVHRLTGLPYLAWVRGGDYYLMRDVRWKRWLMRQIVSINSTIFVINKSSEESKIIYLA